MIEKIKTKIKYILYITKIVFENLKFRLRVWWHNF